MSILDELQWRGLVADCTDTAELTKKIASPITLYCGFDPTADSLHVGHLVPLLALRRFQNFGHHPIAVAGGATGSIGDPSGKSAERSLLTKDQIKANVESVRPQLARLLDFERQPNPAKLVDNADWTAGLSYLDFLRDIGKHFSVNQMVAKESVRARMEDREVGISYTEFSYMLLQAFDFYVLARDHGCELQIGGSDQWGNITAGIDLMRKKLSKQGYGLTMPLITKADGTKFGKTEGGSVWLDPKKTSVYKFYQFWINTADADVIRYLRFFTFLAKEEIESLEKQHAENPGARAAHKALAKAVTVLVHGRQEFDQAVLASEILFGGKLDGITQPVFEGLFGISADVTDVIAGNKKKEQAIVDIEMQSGGVPRVFIEKARLEGAGIPLVELLVYSGLCPSKGQARKDVEGGGVNINNVREGSAMRAVTAIDLLFGKHVLLRKGKKNYVVVTAK
ncbi:MAG TPA: tyrosine--tRNA ligase [Verrucomicrobiae bacterium]